MQQLRDVIEERWLQQLYRERQALAVLATKANLGSQQKCDIYLSYSEIVDLEFKGFLVTYLGDIDRPIAFCPARARYMRRTADRMAELNQIFIPATKIAMAPDSTHHYSGAIRFSPSGYMAGPLPGWVYGLLCVPLFGPWKGEFKSPRPFCPDLFEHMARQPHALRWLSLQSMESALTSHEELSVTSALPARVRQVLTCLKHGYSEKETAAELGISKHTIHVYVKRIYSHFGVHSRGELLSLFMSTVERRDFIRDVMNSAE